MVIPLPPKSSPPKNGKTPCRQNISTVWHFRRNNNVIFLFYRFHQSRYRQKKTKPSTAKNYRHMAITLRLCPPKKPLPGTTLFHFRYIVSRVFCPPSLVIPVFCMQTTNDSFDVFDIELVQVSTISLCRYRIELDSRSISNSKTECCCDCVLSYIALLLLLLLMLILLPTEVALHTKSGYRSTKENVSCTTPLGSTFAFVRLRL